MKIVNHTHLSLAQIQPLVKWLTKGITRRIGKIRVSYTCKHRFTGHIDFGWRFGSQICKAEIKIAFTKGMYPFKVNTERHEQFNFPKYEVNDPLEALVVVLAHEVCHLRKHSLGQKNTEQKAEWYAFKRLQEFRQKRLGD